MALQARKNANNLRLDQQTRDAVALVRAGRYREAARGLEKVLRSGPDDRLRDYAARMLKDLQPYLNRR